MKTPEAVYEYLNSAMDAQEPFLVADKDLLTQLSEMDEAATDERLINKLYKRLSTELIHALSPTAAIIALTTPGYLPVTRETLAAIVLAAFTRGIELGKKIAETETLNNLFKEDVPGPDN